MTQVTLMSLITSYWHLLILGGFVALLFVFFIAGFLLPNLRLKRALKTALKELRALPKDAPVTDLDAVGAKAMTTPKLRHLWSEFSKTLHPQSEPDDFGQERVVRWRLTAPAETYFNAESLVSIELHSEYFKHQPGIFTGLGIIGTFIGLLRGLMTFNISSNPEEVRRSLDALIHGVLEAFFVSAAAIALAMTTTFFEKLAISRRVRQVEELCNLLDSLFDSGAGEEYLSRLVKATESSATQAAQLKDALIGDLKELLTEMTRQQAEAISASFHEITKQHVAAIAEGTRAQVSTTEQSGDKIASAISDALSEPIQKIAAAVQTTSDTNGQVVTRALNEALVAFSQKLEDMFGSQMSNMNQLLLQTTESMRATVSRFDELAANINHAGKNAADAMGERLTAAIESMEKRQESLNRTMAEFVAQLREMVQTSQAETNQRLQETLALMSEKVSSMVAQMEEQARQASGSHLQQQDQLAANAAKLASELGTQMQSTLGAIQGQFAEMVGALRTQSEAAKIANEERQRQFSESADQAVQSLGANVGGTLATLESQLTNFTDLIREQVEASSAHQQQAQREQADQMHSALQLLSTQVQALVGETQNTVRSIQDTAAAMRSITGEATRRMESSAETLSIAADDFAKAGNSVTTVVTQAGQVGEKLSTTAGALSVAATTVNAALSDYQTSREAITRMVSELKTVVDAAKQDATVSQSLVNQITRSAEQLEKAHSSVEGLFESVCDELAQAHAAFAQNVEATLKKSNGAFQKELKDAVDYLKTAVEELGDVAEAIPARR